MLKDRVIEEAKKTFDFMQSVFSEEDCARIITYWLDVSETPDEFLLLAADGDFPFHLRGC